MPDVASIAEPIQELTWKNVTFKWGEEQQTASEELKALVTQAETLGYFRVDCRTRIAADASPVGLGGVLAQEQGGRGELSRMHLDRERGFGTGLGLGAIQHVCVRKTFWAGNGSQTLGMDLFRHVKALCANWEMGVTLTRVRLQSCVPAWENKHCWCIVSFEFRETISVWWRVRFHQSRCRELRACTIVTEGDWRGVLQWWGTVLS